MTDGSPCLGAGKDGSDIGALSKGKNPAVKEADGKYHVVVYAHDKDLGILVLDAIRAAGYANDESYVTDEPNEDANIKCGAASKEDIKAIRELVSAFYDGWLVKKKEFDSDDYDVFINLP